jgi:hypothetical protein
MWPQVPVQTKVRVLPWLLVVAVGHSLLLSTGGLERPADAATAKTKVAGVSRFARADIPRPMLGHYRRTCAGATWKTRQGQRYACWAVLAGIGKVESDHGRSRDPGVRSGVNRFGCCAGPMQFNLRNGPPSTWDAYGRGSPYNPADAVPAARRLLLANGARRNLDTAIWNYNHSRAYVRQVKALARSYQDGRS